jgi:hypothetical protein
MSRATKCMNFRGIAIRIERREDSIWRNNGRSATCNLRWHSRSSRYINNL